MGVDGYVLPLSAWHEEHTRSPTYFAPAGGPFVGFHSAFTAPDWLPLIAIAPHASSAPQTRVATSVLATLQELRLAAAQNLFLKNADKNVGQRLSLVDKPCVPVTRFFTEAPAYLLAVDSHGLAPRCNNDSGEKSKEADRKPDRGSNNRTIGKLLARRCVSRSKTAPEGDK